VLFSPCFIIIPLLIKLTSPGPVIFKQERMGLFGKRFQFLKFRSMSVENDDTIHKKYVQNLIKNDGNGSKKDNGDGEEVYKIKDDPRITMIGKILRRTSLDELPQFFNVLRGDMSLVGPRPPIPYELENYQLWHRRRIAEIKPGITGIWQVYGRSKTTFDEMVRMDLEYIKKWNPMMDIKLLLKTPMAMISGKGAY
jgi:lipopolysaccharide/colanic/teichoic acid biosynthesis glycosyltransferase